MSESIQLILPTLPPTPGELAQLLGGYALVRVGVGQVDVCERLLEDEGEDAVNNCVVLTPRWQDMRSSPDELSRHVDRVPTTATVGTIGVTYEDDVFLSRVVADLADHLLFWVNRGQGEVLTGAAFAARTRRAVVADHRSPRSAEVRRTGEPSWPPSLVDPRRASSQRVEPSWHQGGRVFATVVARSYRAGVGIELSGCAAPGLARWFARRLEDWRTELASERPALLRRLASSLFLVAHQGDASEPASAAPLGSYLRVGIGVRGYAEASQHPEEWVDIWLEELIERAIHALAEGG